MRICLFTISPKLGGGVITKTILLIKYFKSKGHTVDWYYPSYNGDIPSYVSNFSKENSINVKEIFAIPYLRVFDAFDPFRQVKKKYDIYQVISGFCLDGMIFRKLRNNFFIWAASTYASEKYNTNRLKFYRPKELISIINIRLGKYLEKKYAKFAYKVFSNSITTRNKISSEFNIEVDRITVAYPLIDLNRYSFFPLEKKQFKEKYILFIGIFSKRKNIELLLSAFKELNKKIKGVRLKLVGNTNGLFHYYHNLCVEMGISKEVEIIGEVKDIYPFYRDAVVTVLPSHEEGFGMVLAESLACGTPVVSTKCGGTIEIIDDGINGYLVDDDPINMSEAIIKIIQNEKLRLSMSIAGRKKIEQNFSVEKTGEIFLNEYDDYLRTRNNA